MARSGALLPRERIVGLDIGTSKVRLIAADFEHGRLTEIVGVGEAVSEGVRDGAIVDLASASESISSAVAGLQCEAPGDLAHVVVSTSGKHIASLNSRAVTAITRSSRRITQDDVSRANEQTKVIVLPPDREIIHCIPRWYRVDGQDGVLNPVGMYGSRLEVEAHIVTGNYSHTQNLNMVVKSAGLIPGGAVLSSLASAECILYKEERRMGVMLVDIGDGICDIAIYMDGTIAYTAAIPAGGGDISRELSASLRISETDAELVKIELQTSVGTHESVEAIIGKTIDYIFSLIRQELVKSGYYNILPGGVVITGGSAGLKMIAELASRALAMPVRIGLPQIDNQISGLYNRPEYATALGLLLRTSRNSTPSVPSRTAGLKGGIDQIRSILSRLGSNYG